MATYTSRYGLSKPETTDEMQSFMSDYADNMDKIDENLGGGGGSANIVELTQAEYDALPDTKLTDDTLYLIKDANSASDAEFTHVYGLYLDPNNVVYSSFIFDSTEHSWTATADCILTGNMVPPDGSTAYYVRLDGVQVFAGYSAVEDPFVYVKKGQAVTYRGKSGSSMKAYGVVAGSNVTIIPDYASACYSTTEREVGCYVDGKPLYQKSLILRRNGVDLYTYSGYSYLNCLPNDIDFIDIVQMFMPRSGADSGYVDVRNNYNEVQVVPDISNQSIYLYDNHNPTDTILTIRYTKTTDVAGSGQWTPMAQPTHHYSTTEQVIGTWIDGKPCYEITLEDSGSFVSNTEHIIPLPLNADNVRIMSGFVDIGTDWLPISLTLGLGTSSTNGIYCYPNKSNGLHLFSSTWTFTKYSIVIQYTKTTD